MDAYIKKPIVVFRRRRRKPKTEFKVPAKIMGRFLEGALELLDPIMDLQDEVDEINQDEYDRKFKLKEKCEETLRWDENLACLRHPCITSSQKSLFQERSEIVKTLPRFWSTALSADDGLLGYMNEEEQEIMLKYLNSVDVSYDNSQKSGYTIYLSIDINPYFDNLTLVKTFNFTREGIYSKGGTPIRWKNEEHTNMPSFFEWYGEESHNLRDLVAEEIVLDFWPNAHKYYLIGKKKGTEKGRQGLTERKTVTGKRKAVADQGLALSKLTAISDKIQMAEEQANKERHAMKIEQQLVLVKGERIVHKECESSRRQLYNRRSEIIKSIHCFWLIVFSSHYALRHLLSQEDRKIFRFLNSVNVEETEDDEGVISGYTITLKFDKNPYFENDSLEKTISYTVMSIDPLREYTDAKVDIRVSDIHWKEGMDITGNNRAFTNASFFTWFTDLGCVAMKAYDEVADLIKQDLWPDAGRYFVYGNLDNGNMVDLDAIDKTARFTSPLRTFFL